MWWFISEYWDEILLTLVTSGMIALARWLWKYNKNQQKEREARNKANLILLRRGLYADISWCMDHGYAPIWMRENIDAAFKEYKNLGGNGMMRDMINDAYDLPTKPTNLVKKT